MQKHSMIDKVTLLLAFAIIAASNLFAQKIVTIPVTTKDNAMVLQTDKDNRLWIVHFFCNSALDRPAGRQAYLCGKNTNQIIT
jgi:hypothetical protein